MGCEDQPFHLGHQDIAYKTETGLISDRKIVEKMEVTVGSTRIESKRAIKYLEVIADDRLTFKEHVKYIDEKASVTQGALARMMPNIGGPGLFKRRIILAVVTSIMLRGNDKEDTVLDVRSDG